MAGELFLEGKNRTGMAWREGTTACRTSYPTTYDLGFSYGDCWSGMNVLYVRLVTDFADNCNGRQGMGKAVAAVY